MSNQDFDRLTRRTFGDDAYAMLREKIIGRQFAPGQRLHLGSIEGQMGISRTPLREALNRLAVEGLVELRSHRGVFVVDSDQDRLIEFFDVRRLFEVEAFSSLAKNGSDDQIELIAGIVAQMRELVRSEDLGEIYQQYLDMDHKLHESVMDMAGNEQMKRFWEQVNVHVHMARVRYGTSGQNLPLAQQEHEDILAALQARAEDRLRAAIEFHVERARKNLLRDMNNGHEP